MIIEDHSDPGKPVDWSVETPKTPYISCAEVGKPGDCRIVKFYSFYPPRFRFSFFWLSIAHLLLPQSSSDFWLQIVHINSALIANYYFLRIKSK